MDKSETDALFNDFESVTQEKWNIQAKKETGKSDLNWQSYEGFAIKPIYSQSDLDSLEHKKLFQHQQRNGWLLVDNVDVDNERKANAQALDALGGGSDGIHFDGMKDFIQFSKLLKDVWVDNCVISFSCVDNHPRIFENFLNYYIGQNLASQNLRGWINYDPLISSMLSGENAQYYHADLENLFQLSSEFPNFRCLTISSHHFANRGVSIIQEVAYCLATTVEYLEVLKSKKFGIEDAAKRILYSLTVSTNFFLEISKLRAFRVLICKLFLGYGVKLKPSEILIHTQTSKWNKSLLDWENNIIRNSAEAMAGILGGSDFLTITDHNQNRSNDERFISRVSRNISHLLREEGYLDKVTDPSAGSYYIESLTSQIAEQSWQLFLELEKEGGFIQCIEKGIIPDAVSKMRDRRINNFDLRRDLLIGVNIYPNLKESTLNYSTENRKQHSNSEQRIAEQIEDLRQFVETEFVKAGDRPKLIVLNLKDEPISPSVRVFVKSVFASVGFLVEFDNQSKNIFQKNKTVEGVSFDLLLIFIDSDLTEENLAFIKEMEGLYAVIATSSESLKIKELNNYQALERLALHENLKNVLSSLNKRKK